MKEPINRAISYRRVSTEEQAVSGLGLADQAVSIAAAAEQRRWCVVSDLVDEGRSAKDLNRPALTEALQLLDAGEADILVAARLDRVSRSVVDFSGLLERARCGGWKLACLDLGVDTASASGELMAHVMAAFAQHERRLISDRTRRALAQAKQSGRRLGRPVSLPEEVRQRIVSERAAGRTLREIADGLAANGVPTANGGRWWPATVRAVLQSVQLDQEIVVDATTRAMRTDPRPQGNCTRGTIDRR